MLTCPPGPSPTKSWPTPPPQHPPPVVSVSLISTETLRPVAPCCPVLHVVSPCMPMPASLHGLLGEERDIASTSLTARPTPMNVTTAAQMPLLSPNPPRRQTNLHFFSKQLAFSYQALTVQRSPFMVYLGSPSPPSPIFCWFSTNTSPSPPAPPNPTLSQRNCFISI